MKHTQNIRQMINNVVEDEHCMASLPGSEQNYLKAMASVTSRNQPLTTRQKNRARKIIGQLDS
ncbi:MAG: hypothetical protein AWU57_58 [Marinobacter sp. T13-3]|mgnify:CR=1 FL=1|nr:MAG: hypothetical protein AWU57_58 [Marinobacter sp. T13-3]